MAKIVTITWDDSVGDTVAPIHYQVQRKTGISGTYAQIGPNINAGVESFVDSSALIDAQQYYYRVATVYASSTIRYIEANITISGSAFDWSATAIALDPSTNTPQDLSGNNNHGIAIAGATLPVNTAGRNVYTAAGQNAFQLTNELNLGTVSTEIWRMTIDSIPANTTPITSRTGATSDNWFGLKTSGNIHFSVSTATSPTAVTNPITNGTEFTLTVKRNGATATIQFNDDTPVTMTGLHASANRWLQVIGASVGLTRWFDGKLGGYAAWTSELTGQALIDAKAAVAAL